MKRCCYHKKVFRCPYPGCLLGQLPIKDNDKTEKFKKFLALPFPEDDV